MVYVLVVINNVCFEYFWSSFGICLVVWFLIGLMMKFGFWIFFFVVGRICCNKGFFRFLDLIFFSYWGGMNSWKELLLVVCGFVICLVILRVV